MKGFFLASGLFLLLVGCGARTPVGRAPAEKATQAANCQLEFKAVKFCALVEWTSGPDSKLAAGSDYVLKFFPVTGDPKGPYSNPPAAVDTLLQMDCCGAPSAPKSFTVLSPGVFAAKGVVTLKGNWNVVVNLLDAGKNKIDSAKVLFAVP